MDESKRVVVKPPELVNLQLEEMEKVPSAHRFQVAKVEFADEKPDEDGDNVRETAVGNGSVAGEEDATSTTFSLPSDTYGNNHNSYTGYGTHLKTFGKNTTEAIPHVDHYRNLLSATSPLKSRPTLAELHEEKDDIERQRHREPLLSETDTNPEDSKPKDNKSAIKFGWIKGVLIRCLLNIWGVMLFLRLSWVTGQAGTGLATLVVLLSTVVTVITSLSMSAICTNGIVKGGGAYFMISRSLGPEYGGAIGMIFSVANAVAVAMYVVGFAETVRDLLLAHNALMVDEENDIRIIGFITISLLLAIAIIGMEWEARAQVILLGVLLIAMLNFVIGTFIPPSEAKLSKGFTGYRGDVFVDNFSPNFRDGEGFFSVFSIFFPAATGILAGANISGDLKNPQKDIPLGTFTAIAISTVSYIVVVWILGSCIVRDATGPLVAMAIDAVNSSETSSTMSSVLNSTPSMTVAKLQYTFENIQNCSLSAEGGCKYGLLNDYQVMEMMSGFGPLITAGIFSATLSSALASLVSAPKVFQAVCKDKIFPKVQFFAKGYGTSENPRRAYVLAYVIGLAFILIGDLNAIAPIISNFFLMAYMLINYSCFDNSLAKSPGWRPSFKYYNMWLSLIGALLCVAVMFIINWWTALVTFGVIGAIFVYVHYRKPDVNWGSSTQAHVYRSALTTALKLAHTEDHIKNFRPQVLVLTGFPCNRPELVYFVNSLTKKISLMVCGHILEGSHSDALKEYRRFRRGYVNKWLTKRRIKGFYSVTIAPDFRQGARSLMQNVGIGKLKPNILMMGFKSTWKTESPESMDAYFSVIHDAFDYEFGVGVLRTPERLYKEGEDMLEEENLPQEDENNYDERHFHDLRHILKRQKRRKFEDSAMEEDSPLPSPSRRNSSPEVETPPQDLEAQTPEDLNTSFSRSLSKIESSIHFAKKQKGTIDVWWLFDDGGLTLLVPYILQTKQQWKNCGLRVFTAGTKRGELVREQKQMAQLLSKFRIECQDMKIIADIGKLPTEKSKQEFNELLKGLVLDEDNGETVEQYPWKTTEDEMLLLKEKTNRQMRLRELLQEHSMDASLIVMTLPVPRKGTCSSSLYMAWLETLTRDMPPILLLRGNQQSVLTFYS
ncbi:solute carrier family 12 member 3-like isoform X2 [Mercenaria mercenaria]|uniref:solute carrier family 12 member 3-like isoform X2 n=1 Tax=Mercenaria mercenaria TaxID=6596 RepID=UPI00234EE0A2|nr:solute carrier family 12 member 3-like isoform X2 [Mercenaria mercenaria]